MTPRKQKILKQNGGMSRSNCLGIGPAKLKSQDPDIKAWVLQRQKLIKQSQQYQCFTSKASRRRPRQIGA